MKIKIAFLFVISTFIIVFTYCQGSTEPGETFKDPREMTWTVDTLMYPGSWQTLLFSLSGNSATDLFVCGHTDIHGGKLWHYNGFGWNSVDIYQFIHNTSIDLQQIRKVGNDLWIVGSHDNGDVMHPIAKSLVVQYNGTWIDHNLNYNSYLYAVTGTSNSDIWACGKNGLVLHYNGLTWQADTVKIKRFLYDADYVISGITRHNNETFLTARVYYSGKLRRENYYIRGNMNDWEIIDSTIFSDENWGDQEKWGNKGMLTTDSGNIYSFGYYGVWKLNKNNNWFSLLKNNYDIKSLIGLRDNYLIAMADFGMAWFYDGVSWEILSNLIKSQSNINFYDGWTDGKEIFLLGVDYYHTYIVHGK